MTPAEHERIAAILDKLKRQTVADNIVYGPAYAETAAAIAEVVREARIAVIKNLHDCRIQVSEKHVGIQMIPDIYATNNLAELRRVDALRKPDGGEGQTDV